MAEASGKRVKAAPKPHAEETPHVCTVGFCPICFAVSSIQPLAPEAIEHLLNAGREFLLALKAVLDSRADAVGKEDGGSRKLERIDIA